MGQRRVRPGQAGHVEGQRLGAAGPHLPFERQRQLAFSRASLDAPDDRRKGAVGDGAGGTDPLDLGRFLGGTIRLDPARHGNQLDVRRGLAQLLPQRVTHDAVLDSDAPGPQAGQQGRPDCGEIVGRRFDAGPNRLGLGLHPVARVGQHRDLVAGNQEAAGLAGNPVLAVAQPEAGQIAHVFGPQAEVSVDAGLAETSAQPRQPGRTGGGVGFGPSSQIGRAWRRREVGWMR